MAPHTGGEPCQRLATRPCQAGAGEPGSAGGCQRQGRAALSFPGELSHCRVHGEKENRASETLAAAGAASAGGRTGLSREVLLGEPTPGAGGGGDAAGRVWQGLAGSGRAGGSLCCVRSLAEP